MSYDQFTLHISTLSNRGSYVFDVTKLVNNNNQPHDYVTSVYYDTGRENQNDVSALDQAAEIRSNVTIVVTTENPITKMPNSHGPSKNSKIRRIFKKL